MAQTSKTEPKVKRKWMSWKTQVIAVAILGAIAGVTRFAWYRTKRAAKKAA